MGEPRLLLGFDFGMRQIGVAVGQPVTRQARGLCILKAQDSIPDWTQIQSLLDEWNPDALIVGLPLNMDGTPSEMSRLAEKFARRLHGRFNLPCHMQDERLTSFEAKQYRTPQQARQKELVDATAAALLLESWLNAHTPSVETP